MFPGAHAQYFHLQPSSPRKLPKGLGCVQQANSQTFAPPNRFAGFPAIQGVCFEADSQQLQLKVVPFQILRT